MKIGLSLPTMLPGLDRHHVLAWARRIEDDGYDTIGLGERVSFHNLEMFSVLSAAAAVTERARIAATIVILPMHSEVWVAKQMATLDVISGGRAVLGVGVGGRNEDYRSLGRSFDRRFDRMDAQVDRIRRIWAGEPPEPGLDPVGPPPVQDHIPILSGALGPKSLARSARWADGIAGFELDPSIDAMRGSVERMDAAWDEAGRGERPYRMTSFWFALGDDGPVQLREYAQSYLGVFGAETADAMASLCTVSSADRLLAAMENARDLGFDEIQLVPTSASMADLDQLSGIVTEL